MRLALKVLTSVAFCCGTLSAQSAQQAPAQENPLAQELIAKSKSIYQAVKSKDTQMLNSLLAPDFHIVWSDGKEHGKGELVGTAEEGSVREFMFYDPRVTTIDANSALVTYNLILTMPEGDDQIAPRYQKICDLWLRQDGDWRLKFEQSTPLRPID